MRKHVFCQESASCLYYYFLHMKGSKKYKRLTVGVEDVSCTLDDADLDILGKNCRELE